MSTAQVLMNAFQDHAEEMFNIFSDETKVHGVIQPLLAGTAWDHSLDLNTIVRPKAFSSLRVG